MANIQVISWRIANVFGNTLIERNGVNYYSSATLEVFEIPANPNRFAIGFFGGNGVGGFDFSDFDFGVQPPFYVSGFSGKRAINRSMFGSVISNSIYSVCHLANSSILVWEFCN
jgi:hypothetical protein